MLNKPEQKEKTFLIDVEDQKTVTDSSGAVASLGWKGWLRHHASQIVKSGLI